MIKNLPKRFQGKTLDDIHGYNQVVQYCRHFPLGESIIFTGGVGRGKTHMAAATGDGVRDVFIPEVVKKDYPTNCPNKRRPRVLYLSTIGFLLECNDLAISGKKKQYLDGLIAAPKHNYSGGQYNLYEIDGWDLIILDDFGAERLTDAARQNLFYLINGRYESMVSMIITTNLSINEIHAQEPRIASRFAEMGKIFELDGGDYRV